MSKIVHLSTYESNHLSIMLHVQAYSHPRQSRERSFKFEESWLLRSDYENVVQEAWGKTRDDRVRLA